MSDFECFDEGDLNDEDFELMQELFPEFKQALGATSLEDSTLKAILYDAYFNVDDAIDDVNARKYSLFPLEHVEAPATRPAPR